MQGAYVCTSTWVQKSSNKHYAEEMVHLHPCLTRTYVVIETIMEHTDKNEDTNDAEFVIDLHTS